MRHVPLLVLAAGQRCGSTLVQRLLTSHPEVLIWGEHDGQVDRVLEAGEGLLAWSADAGHIAREEFERHAYQGWMANLIPDTDRILDSLRRFVEALYAEPAAALGRPIWGFKEVRYGPSEVRRLHRLFPDLAVILLVRDPRDVLRSLDEWERWSRGIWTRERTKLTVEHWQRLARSFLPGTAFDPVPVLRLRYEDVVNDPALTCEIVGKHTGLDPHAFDRAVFAKRVHVEEPIARFGRDLREWEGLPDSLRQLLAPPELRRIANAWGYDI